MKYLLIVLLSICGRFASAQEESPAPVYPDTVHIALTAVHHAFIVYWMPDKGSSDQFRYVKQVAQQMTFPVDSAQVIKVAVPVNLVTRMYRSIGGQQERLVSIYNDQIKAALIAQLMPRRPDVLNDLGQIMEENVGESYKVLNLGFQYLQAVKL